MGDANAVSLFRCPRCDRLGAQSIYLNYCTECVNMGRGHLEHEDYYRLAPEKMNDHFDLQMENLAKARPVSEMFMRGLDKMTAYCLKYEEEVEIVFPEGVIGMLYSCPLCGVIESQAIRDLHVFNPSEPLLERLKATAGVANV